MGVPCCDPERQIDRLCVAQCAKEDEPGPESATGGSHVVVHGVSHITLAESCGLKCAFGPSTVPATHGVGGRSMRLCMIVCTRFQSQPPAAAVRRDRRSRLDDTRSSIEPLSEEAHPQEHRSQRRRPSGNDALDVHLPAASGEVLRRVRVRRHGPGRLRQRLRATARSGCGRNARPHGCRTHGGR